MSSDVVTAPSGGRRRALDRTSSLGLGVTTLWLSLLVALPLAALIAKSTDGGIDAFWHAVTLRPARSALLFSIESSLVVAAINVVMGTLVAWVLVRDRFPGKAVVNALIDLPFALPTVVAGITLRALTDDQSPLGIHIAFTKAAVGVALLFVTLPFVVRSVQPVLLELDTEMEEAAASLGASPFMTFRRIILPNLVPAIISGAALAFARAVGEFGSLVIISGNKPFDTLVAPVYISQQVESSESLVGAASVSVVLLALSLVILIGIRVAGGRVR